MVGNSTVIPAALDSEAKPWASAQELYAMGVSKGGESEFSPLVAVREGFPSRRNSYGKIPRA